MANATDALRACNCECHRNPRVMHAIPCCSQPLATPAGSASGKVQRWTLANQEYDASMQQSDDGEWIEYTDYAALQAEVAGLWENFRESVNETQDALIRAEAAEAEAARLREDAETAPWPDHAGNPIHDRDRIRHPNGVTGTVVYLPALGAGGEAWRVIYDGEVIASRLSLQVGDKGQAVVLRADAADTMAGEER